MNKLSNTVNGLWISGPLSSVELLTVYSYCDQGYDFILWVYDNTDIYRLPPNAQVKDARYILAQDQIFTYNYKNQFGHGKGSYAGFSDIFRYKLLYEMGGWWTDMDVSCLQRFSFTGPYVFRTSKENEHYVVGNIMHVPPKSELMGWCFEESIKYINQESKDWMLPIKILNEGITKYNLSGYVFSFTNSDSWPVVCRLLTTNRSLPAWQAIHWMNEEFRRLDISKEKFLTKSHFGELLCKYKLGSPVKGIVNQIIYRFKASRMYYALLHLSIRFYNIILRYS